MHLEIITIFCLCDDFCHAYGQKDDAQAQMSSAEVMTTALVAAWQFHGNQEASRVFLKENGYIPKMLSKSRFNRRLHQLPDTLWQALFYLLAQIHQQNNPSGDYIVDSGPVPLCDNLRIKRCKIYRNEAHRGYIASKRRYFYGIKAHLVVTKTGKPVDLTFTPGSVGDRPGFRRLFLALPEDSDAYADKAYTDYEYEDALKEIANITLTAARRSNSKRPHPGHIGYLCHVIRKRVETTFSQVTAHFGRFIHAVTARGFELKVYLAFLAYSILG